MCSRPSFTVRDFAMKRVFRIYPLYWILMTVVAIMIAIGQWRHESLWHFVYSMSLLPQQGAPVYDFSWTLEREMVFYALAALIVPVGGIPMLAITLFALTFVGWLYGNPWTWHLTAASQAEFLAGVIVFLLRKPLALLGPIPLVNGTILLWIGSTHEYPFWTAPAVAALLAGFINIRPPWHRAPFRWLVRAGDASYSIFLLHYLVFFLAANVSVRLLSLPEWACEPWRFATILTTCIISTSPGL
ncbi:hypothetical protein LRP30_27685 [Bradyrhizobium sp. C-145]|uniref:acyltransferase family protein n=1 Tax=Bradyrhizobium sp. C-145 TaxID=574727 RepID=UPI00201B73A9|nr:acyltransferase family protein [Bradyrhizobium sp. C-145]UQR68053.1 hypothetical protein LRP30_27685 [Bradyrhizobium sp. C-145]